MTHCILFFWFCTLPPFSYNPAELSNRLVSFVLEYNLITPETWPISWPVAIREHKQTIEKQLNSFSGAVQQRPCTADGKQKIFNRMFRARTGRRTKGGGERRENGWWHVTGLLAHWEMRSHTVVGGGRGWLGGKVAGHSHVLRSDWGETDFHAINGEVEKEREREREQPWSELLDDQFWNLPSENLYLPPWQQLSKWKTINKIMLRWSS